MLKKNKKLFVTVWLIVMFLHIIYYYNRNNEIVGIVSIPSNTIKAQKINFIAKTLISSEYNLNIDSNEIWHNSINRVSKHAMFQNKNFQITKVRFDNTNIILNFKVSKKDDSKNQIKILINNSLEFYYEAVAERILDFIDTYKLSLELQKEKILFNSLDEYNNTLKLIDNKIRWLNKNSNTEYLIQLIKTDKMDIDIKQNYKIDFITFSNKYTFLLQGILLSFFISIISVMIYKNRKKLFSF